ncbi:MAG: YjjG family noncanonical pyrimidine nucleotidase [Spirochaetia bacterium]|jgi:YjjG family noncanonical pyrimidine nucleotidase|nr:YjjG family noncanonical pyrimidine nucleotidase [Spirochaetia bacterium]
MDYTTLLFDADRTLFDFPTAERTALAFVAQACGLEYTDYIYETYAAINQTCWNAYERNELTQEELKTERFRQFLTKTNCHTELSPEQLCTIYAQQLSKQGQIYTGVDTLLQKLQSEGYVLALVTNGIATTQHGRLEASGLGPFFRKIFISEEMGIQKPSPAFFSHVLSELAVSKKQCLIIGDSLSSDIKGGNLSGIDTAWYNPTHLPLSEIATPTYTIDKLDQLCAILA